ncbi:MAG: GNAT family N-acetyltransferase [Paracoccaceae bacterium]|nr:GNAT family N-acetyltransferase [Paracoccaceae bacterium]
MTAFHETPSTGPAAELARGMQVLVPVVETQRLRLRCPRIEDFDAVAEIYASPRSKGLFGPMNRRDAWREFMQMTATWPLRGHGFWTVEDRATATVLGFAGIGAEPGDREPELGYFLTEAAEGRGYATEAVRAIRDYGFGLLGLTSMVSYISADNARSVAVARRVGAVEDPPEGWPHPDTLVFRHPRPEGPV